MTFLRLLAFLLMLTVARAASEFPHDGSDLKPDPVARFGALTNGLRYVIYANHEPRERASLRLLVRAGSLNETDDQRGLAHFLEHMAFNGSTHYAPGTLVEFFQRMGMTFGGDTNANTGFDRTVYLLELPDVKGATLTEGLRVFSDYATGLLLEPKEIEKERGIIQSEKRAHDSVGFRTFLAQYEFLLGGTLFPQRIPIGDAKVIATAGREPFVDFYDTWYRPELMSVVVVGDIDPDAMEREIKATFANVAPRAPARSDPDRGQVVPRTGTRVFYHPEPEAPSTTVAISAIEAYPGERDTAANRLKDLPRSIATAIVNRRLSILAKKENAPFIGGGMDIEEAFDFYRETSISLTCKAGQWQAALAVADQELRRALQYGFQPGELQEVVANYINDLEQEVKTAPTRRSAGIANQIVESIQRREVFTAPEDDLKLYKPALEKITVADCLDGLRKAWSPGGRSILVSGNAALAGVTGPTPTSTATSAATSSQSAVAPVYPEGSAESAILAAYEKSLAVPVAGLENENQAAWAYTDFGAAGTVTKREHIADLDLELITFSNGVRLNVKKTPFQAGVINLNARVGTGIMTEPRDQRGLAALTGATFDAGGLGKHSIDDQQRILAGKNVGVRLAIAQDAFIFRSSTTPGDLLLDLQLLTAKLVDPGYRPEALRQVRKGIDQLYLSFEHTTSGPMSREIANLLASGDPRFGLPEKEVLLSRTLDEVRQWLTPQLSQGAIELGVVGDVDIEATIAAVAQTLGALPPRAPKPALAEMRNVHFPEQPFDRQYEISSEIPKGLVAVYWPTTDESDVRRTRRLGILTTVLEDRLRVKVREELGGTYSPHAGSYTSDTFAGYGYISASVDIEPGMAKKIAGTVVDLADDLAEHGATEDELMRAKQPMLTAIKESVRNNGYWLGAVLSRAQEKPEVLEWARSRTADVESITTKEINEYAKAYLGRARSSRVAIVPAAKAGVDAATTPASAVK